MDSVSPYPQQIAVIILILITLEARTTLIFIVSSFS